MSRKLNASLVSRQIRQLTDVRVSPPERQHKHEGVFVRGDVLGGVSVVIDLHVGNARREAERQITEALSGLYAIERRDDSADEEVGYPTVYLSLTKV